MSEDIKNQNIESTINVPEPLGRASVGTWQEDFPLTGRDYEHIKNGKPITLNWANAILLTTIGFGINMLGKGISNLAGILPFGSEPFFNFVYAVASAALASGMGYAIWYMALPHLRATTAATVQLSVPAIAAGGGVMLLSEPVTLRLAASSAAILGRSGYL